MYQQYRKMAHTYLQGRNRDGDLEKGLVDMLGKGEDGTN